MNDRSRILLGVALLLLGGLLLTTSVISSLFGLNLMGFVWRLWPLTVLGVGLALVVPPVVVRGKRGLGAMFIPGLPVLTTGGLLLLASVFDAWQVWAWLWPLELISLATGFVLAAIYMGNVWLAFPAVIIGLNGMVFQFCAITGLWGWWSVLWVVEPLSIGLAFLLAGVATHKSALTVVGLSFCAAAGAGLLLMLTVLGAWGPVRWLGPALIIVAGVLLLAWGLIKPIVQPRSALE
ncbi:MAG: hypothetical protein PVJ34_10635 [Anaerolineae bacterium]|jgi:hypothetical protein